MEGITVNLDDQYLICTGDTPADALPGRIGAPFYLALCPLPLPVRRLIGRGGFGELSLPLRAQVLGLRYRSRSGAVSVGGRVVKNVMGYDLTRLLIGCGVECVEEVTFRIRPGRQRHLARPRAAGAFQPELFAELGWSHAWKDSAQLHLLGDGKTPPGPWQEWTGPAAGPEPGELEDARGLLALQPPAHPLAERVLRELELVALDS